MTAKVRVVVGLERIHATGKPDSFKPDTIDIRGGVAHRAHPAGAGILPADVVLPNYQDIGSFALSSRRLILRSCCWFCHLMFFPSLPAMRITRAGYGQYSLPAWDRACLLPSSPSLNPESPTFGAPFGVLASFISAFSIPAHCILHW